MIGFEQDSVCRLPSTFFSNSGSIWQGMYWDGYQAHMGDAVFGNRRYGNDVPDAYLNITLKGVAEGLRPEDFSEAEKENLQKLIEEGFSVMRNNGSVCVNALVFKDGMKFRLSEYLDTWKALKKTTNELWHLSARDDQQKRRTLDLALRLSPAFY